MTDEHRRAMPGLVAVGVAILVTEVTSRLVPAVPTLLLAVALGMAAGSRGMLPRSTHAGLAVGRGPFLRLGVVLLGFRLVVGDIARLGGLRAPVLIVAAVAVSFVGVQALARRGGLDPDLSVLIATGYAICGASAIAAVQPLVQADDEDAALAIALVTLYGSLAVLALPVIGAAFDLPEEFYGVWVGASVHDVGQVVAAASARGDVALDVGVVVKLGRVLLLAPLLVWVAASGSVAAAAPQSGRGGTRGRLRTWMPPPFVVGFLAAMAVASLGVVPAGIVDAGTRLSGLLLAGALFALGSEVRPALLRRIGPRPFAVGLVAWIGVALVGAVPAALLTG